MDSPVGIRVNNALCQSKTIGGQVEKGLNEQLFGKG